MANALFVLTALSVIAPAIVMVGACTQHAECPITEYCRSGYSGNSNYCYGCYTTCYDSVTGSDSCPAKCACTSDLDCDATSYCRPRDYASGSQCTLCQDCGPTCPTKCQCAAQSSCGGGLYCGNSGYSTATSAQACRNCSSGCINNFVVGQSTSTTACSNVCPATTQCNTHSDCASTNYCTITHKCVACASSCANVTTFTFDRFALYSTVGVDLRCPSKCAPFSAASGDYFTYAVAANASVNNLRAYFMVLDNVTRTVAQFKSAATPCAMTFTPFSGDSATSTTTSVGGVWLATCSGRSHRCQNEQYWFAVVATSLITSQDVYYVAPEAQYTNERDENCALGEALVVVIIVVLVIVGVVIIGVICAVITGIVCCARASQTVPPQQYQQHQQMGIVQGQPVVQGQQIGPQQPYSTYPASGAVASNSAPPPQLI